MSRPLKIQTESVTHAQPKKKTATDLPGRRIHSRGEVGRGALVTRSTEKCRLRSDEWSASSGSRRVGSRRR
jgi:hypothetical protein